MKYQFKYIETNLFGDETGKTMVMDFSADTLSTILENFEDFLCGCGFVIDGDLDIVRDEDDQPFIPEAEYNVSADYGSYPDDSQPTLDGMNAHSDFFYDTERNR
jgi:hypothetical protein